MINLKRFNIYSVVLVQVAYLRSVISVFKEWKDTFNDLSSNQQLILCVFKKIHEKTLQDFIFNEILKILIHFKDVYLIR